MVLLKPPAAPIPWNNGNFGPKGYFPYPVMTGDNWENIAIRDGCVILNSKHTKTGGARHVTILPVLAKWLKFCRDKSKPGPGTPICPKGWTIKWRKIRKKAGWGGRKKSWVPDCLRHTYASYHA